MAVFQSAYSQDESFTSDSKQTALVQKIVPVPHFDVFNGFNDFALKTSVQVCI